MILSRKHFEFVADVLRRTRPVVGTPDFQARITAWWAVRLEFIHEFQDNAPTFNVDRFTEWTERNQI